MTDLLSFRAIVAPSRAQGCNGQSGEQDRFEPIQAEGGGVGYIRVYTLAWSAAGSHGEEGEGELWTYYQGDLLTASPAIICVVAIRNIIRTGDVRVVSVESRCQPNARPMFLL